MGNTPGDAPVEVNFLESVVTLSVDLSSGFSIDDINVTPKDQLINTAAQAYTVGGYMCQLGTDTPGVDAGNLLTTFDETACANGDYCQFSSILFAAFYATEGQVSGSGVASMQFGARRLSSSAGGGLRALQEQDAEAATSEFDISVSLSAADDGP